MTCNAISKLHRTSLVPTHFVQNGCHNFVVDHGLVGCWGEDLVELICLVAQRTWTHGKVYGCASDSVGRYHNAAVFAHFAIIAPSTPDDDVDVCLLSSIAVEVDFSLEG